MYLCIFYRSPGVQGSKAGPGAQLSSKGRDGKALGKALYTPDRLQAQIMSRSG